MHTMIIRDMTSALPTFPIPFLELKLLDVHSSLVLFLPEIL